MRTIIQISNIEHTSAIEEYVSKKLKSVERLLKGRDEAIMRIEVGMSTKHHKKGDVYFAEASLHIKGKELRSVERADDLYAAIDAMKDEIFDELTSYMGKQQTEKKQGARVVKSKLKRG
jgi:ribosomal subunit interface protein